MSRQREILPDPRSKPSTQPRKEALKGLGAKPKNSSVSCEPCRKAKRKCDEQRPSCGECIRKGRECAYAAGPEETRMDALKRRVDELEKQNRNMTELYAQMQSRSITEASAILQRLRRDPNVDAVLGLIKHGEMLMQLAQSSKTNWPGDMIEQQGVQYVDARLGQISAESWTSVPCDDGIFRGLLSIYLAREEPRWGVVDVDLFLNGAMNERSRYCSALLVNAMLALAAHHYDSSEGEKTDPSRESQATIFLAEARRLWAIAEWTDSITNIQASILLTLISLIDGRDKIGWTFYTQGIRMAKNMGLFEPLAPHAEKGGLSANMQKARVKLAWASYNFQSFMALGLGEQFPIPRIPQVPIPNRSTADAEEEKGGWVIMSGVMPGVRQTVPIFSNQLFTATCQLSTVINDITKLADQEKDDAWSADKHLQQAMVLHERLDRWTSVLPTFLRVENATCPAHVYLLCHRRYADLMLWRPFVSGRQSSNRRSEGAYRQAMEIRSRSLVELGRLITYCADKWPLPSQNSTLLVYCQALACECLQSVRNEQNRHFFMKAVTVIRALSTGMYFAEAVLGFVQKAAERADPALVPEAGDAFDIFIIEPARSRRVFEKTKSQWSMHNLGEEIAGSQLTGFGDLLRDWGALKLSDVEDTEPTKDHSGKTESSS